MIIHEPPTAPVFRDLRQNILSLKPYGVGLYPTADLPTVWGLLAETGYSNGISTLVMLADGTTSLYFSSGGGFIGCGEHQQVAEASLHCLRTTERYTDRMEKVETMPLPVPGQVNFYALTYRGVLRARLDEQILAQGQHPLSGLFYASQAVLTQVRLLEESKRRC
jgi:hypothetical protein